MKKKLLSGKFFLLPILFCMLAITAAQAVETNEHEHSVKSIEATTGENSSRDALTLDTVMVTANKMEENLQEVPQSITVIDEEILEEKGIKNVNDLIKEVPNMSVGTWGDANAVNFRGLNTSFFTSKNPVVIYVDGVPISNQYAYETALNNAKRVEILRGPQGSLYGKDAIGGVINIVSKEPDDVWSGNVGFEYGSYKTIDGKFNVSAPLIDEKLYFGLHARGNKTDGFITNHYNDDKKAGEKDIAELGAYLLARPTDRLSLRLNLSHSPKNNNFSSTHVLQGSHDINDFKRDGAKHKNHNENLEYEDDSMDTQSIGVSYDFDELLLSSSTTHMNTKGYGKQSQDYGATLNNELYNILDRKVHEYTQELRLSNKADKVRWVAGLYGDREEVEMDMDLQTPANLAYSMPKSQMDNYVEQTAQTMAIFGQVRFPVIDKLDLTLGARFQRFEKDTYNLASMHFMANPNAIMPVSNYKAEKTWDVFLPKLALDYKLNDKLMTYFSFSQGYMPGGFAYFPLSDAGKATFEPQRSNNYEFGIKGDYNSFNFTADIFRLDIKDIHIMEYVNGIYETGNAEKAHSQGGEFDFNYWPTNEIEISGAFGFIDAKYDDYGNGIVKLDGKRIEKTPQYTGNIAIAYYHGSGIYGRIDGDMRGKTTFYKIDNTAMETNEAIIANVKLGYKINNFDIYVYAKNITDEEYVNFHYDRGDVSLAGFNAPRTFGLGINYKF